MKPPYSLINDNRCAELASLAATAPPGNFVEVGVYKGGSAFWLAKVASEQRRALHLFDTFTGHPHALPTDTNGLGEFSDTSVEAVQAAVPSAIIHAGIFPATLPHGDVLNPLAFVHCDCDQYQSVRDVINVLFPMLVPGGIMAFDDMDTHGGKTAIMEVFWDKITISHSWFCVRKPL